MKKRKTQEITLPSPSSQIKDLELEYAYLI